MNQRIISVLGMHRSGTSVLAGTLQTAGVFLGPVAEHSPGNAVGNREWMRIYRMHDRVLESNGFSWIDPPPPGLAPRWGTDEVSIFEQRVLPTFAGSPIWGFKDPRTLLVLDFWKQRFPHLEAVGIFRNPASVAISLNQRHPEISHSRALDLWCTYNQRLITAARTHAIPLICFDLAPKQFDDALGILLDMLNLPAKPFFFQPRLRHHNCDSLPGGEAERLYEDLRNLPNLCHG